MDCSGTASGPGWDETPEQKLQAVVSHLLRAVEGSARAGSKYEPLGDALVFRLAAQSLHVVGDSLLAAEFRRLVAAGAVPGWDLHPVPAGRTPLHVLTGPLHRLSGSNRFYNLLEREGFAYVEEVAVTPEGCLLEFRNSGPRFITAVRQAIADLGFGGAEARTGCLLAPGDAGPLPAADPVPPAGLPADAARALQVAAAWAVAERGAQELGDLLTLAPGVGDLPPDVARSWDRIRLLSLQPLAGAALPDSDLPRLAGELMDELEERRRLILASRSFAETPRTYGSLAAELGVCRERVRQLEASALQQLASAAAHDRYRPLRWRAVSAAQPDRERAAAIPGAPQWLRKMLSWLSGQAA